LRSVGAGPGLDGSTSTLQTCSLNHRREPQRDQARRRPRNDLGQLQDDHIPGHGGRAENEGFCEEYWPNQNPQQTGHDTEKVIRMQFGARHAPTVNEAEAAFDEEEDCRDDRSCRKLEGARPGGPPGGSLSIEGPSGDGSQRRAAEYGDQGPDEHSVDSNRSAESERGGFVETARSSPSAQS